MFGLMESLTPNSMTKVLSSGPLELRGPSSGERPGVTGKAMKLASTVVPSFLVSLSAVAITHSQHQPKDIK